MARERGDDDLQRFPAIARGFLANATHQQGGSPSQSRETRGEAGSVRWRLQATSKIRPAPSPKLSRLFALQRPSQGFDLVF